MLTRSDIEAMTPEQQTQLFESLAETFYGTARNGPMIERDFGISRPTVFAWRRKHNTPWAVLYTLDAWVNSEVMTARQIVEDAVSLPAQLADITAGLGRVTATLSSLARRMPAMMRPDPEPSSLPPSEAVSLQSPAEHTEEEPQA